VRWSGRLSLALALVSACGSAHKAEPSPEAGGTLQACANGKESYRARQATLTEALAAKGCQTDLDCGTLWESNACVNNCGTTLPVAGSEATTRELADFAKTQCSTCPAIPTPPCVPPRPAVCQQGRCREGQ
jgi:hypothetical protein